MLERLDFIAADQPASFVYFLTLYNIFKDFLEDIDEENIIRSKTGFKDTLVWNKLYKFQKDGVLGAIDKLEKHNGALSPIVLVWAKPSKRWRLLNITSYATIVSWCYARKNCVITGRCTPSMTSATCLPVIGSITMSLIILVTINDGEEVAMPFGVKIGIVFLETFTIPFEELVKAKALLDLRFPDFPEHECIDRVAAHDRVEQDAYL